jgi:hypothetical protein
MRRRSALLALLAVLLHALAPLYANAAPAGAVDHVQLCTAQGVVTVEVESSGTPSGKPSTPDHCSVCAFQGSVAAPSQAAPVPPALAGATLAAPDLPLPYFVASESARPRAPPQHS